MTKSVGQGLAPTSQLRVFAEGQEWSIKSSPPSTLKVVIGRAESWQGKTVVHVSILDIPNLHFREDTTFSEIAHVPFEASALARSVDELIAIGVPSPRDFEDGYREWKERHGGIYTISVAEVVATAQATLRK